MRKNKKATVRISLTLHSIFLYVAYAVALSCLAMQDARAAIQKDTSMAVDSMFTVESFRQLPTDVTAFIDAVRDLNGEACALVKVVAPADFAFSSPLGIVKRRDEVGEIWLFLPKGTKMLTIKHPRWGVLRNYSLGVKLESRMTYEMRIRVPQPRILEKHDTIVYTQTVVDTVTVAPIKRVVQLHGYTLLTASMYTDGPSWGIMAAIMRRHGAYVHIASKMQSTHNTVGSCNREGYRPNYDNKPYYTGCTETSSYTLTIGAIHRLGRIMNIFEGVGYGRNTTVWQLAESEGGGWLRNDAFSYKGFTTELGILISVGRLSFSASALNIAGKHWQGCVGVGICIGKARVITKRK